MSATLIGNLSGKETIWRYMTLDRLINVLDDKSLFMASLGTYNKSDPYEGFPPPKVLKIIRDILPSSLYYSEDKQHSQDLSNLKVFFERTFLSSAVSCWYQDEEESEAMWKLYGDSGKAIAIRTTVGNLSHALGDKFEGKIARVRYVNYTKTTYEDAQSIMESQAQNSLLHPIYKRHSYAHEKEVRAYIGINGAKLNDPSTYKSHTVPIDCHTLIKEIVVSPFCGNSYLKAVKAVARAFGLEEKVRQSTLISDLKPIFSEIEKNPPASPGSITAK